MRKMKNIIYLPKDHYENLEKFYNNFDSMKEFMQLVLTPDQYDCWLFQNQYIKENFFGDKPIYKLGSSPVSSKTIMVDDVKIKRTKPKKKDIKIYLDEIQKRFNKEE